jgi:WD40-like Beta Propeller Repeat
VVALALAAAFALGGCPHDASLGTVRYARGALLHEISLADCRDRVVGAAPRPTQPAVGGVVVRQRALWLRRGKRLVPLTRPLPMLDGLTRTPSPVTVSPDRRWLVWRASPNSASISSDGLPLYVTRLEPGGRTRLLAARALAYDDYLTWCGANLVYVSGGDRVATHNKRLLAARPPDWRPRPLWRDSRRTFGSVACAPDGRSAAVLSQRASANPSFFATRWQLWRVGLDGSRRLLDRPPAGFADESPRWSPDGRSLLFVRERNGHGTLMLWRDGRVTGPIADLGYSLGYYGHHDWEFSWRP